MSGRELLRCGRERLRWYMARPVTRKHPDDLRPCNQVEVCRRNEGAACDNCYDRFWRPHGPLISRDAEGVDAEEMAVIEARAETEARS